MRSHTGSNVRPFGLSQQLCVDRAASITSGLLEVMGALRKAESAVIQGVIGPAQQRQTLPIKFIVARALGLIVIAEEAPDQRRAWRQKAMEVVF